MSFKITCWESNFIVNVYKYTIIRASSAFTSNLPLQVTFAGVEGVISVDDVACCNTFHQLSTNMSSLSSHYDFMRVPLLCLSHP